MPEKDNIDNIKKLFDKNKNLYPYIQESSMFTEIQEVVDKYSGTISTVAAIGVVSLIKDCLLQGARE